MRPSLLSLALLGAALAPGAARAQSAPRHATVLDLTGAVGPTLNYGSAVAWRLWGLDAAGRFQAGAGVRVSHFFAEGYTLDHQAGPEDFSIQVPEPRLTSFNAAFHLRARVAGPLQLGFNLDVAGLTVGPGRTREAAAAAVGTPVRPVRGNLLLGGTRDRGSLNSEFYAALALPRGLSVRAGLSHLVTGYQDDATRFRRFRSLAALGLSYQLP